MDKNTPKKILIIEDDQSLAAAYRLKLSQHFSTRSAFTGDEGLKSALDWLPDLIVLDLFLPGKSGQEVLTELRINEKTKNIPVIVLTNLEGQYENMKKLGASDCMIKTEISMEDILKKIVSYL